MSDPATTHPAAARVALTLAGLALGVFACSDAARNSEPGDPPAEQPAPVRRDTTRSPVVPAFRLRLEPARHDLHAEIEIDLPRRTSVHLLFRSGFEGYPGLDTRLQSLEARSSRGSLPIEPTGSELGSGHYSIPDAPAGDITISYRQRLTPPDDSRLYHVVSQLGREGGHLIGRDGLPLIWTGAPLDRPLPLSIWFGGLPTDWRVATLQPRSGNSYHVDQVLDAVFVVGPLRSRQFNVGPRTLTAAIHGAWPVDDASVLGALNEIAGSLHRLAADAWTPGDYLVGAGRVPGSVPGYSSGGQVIGRSAIVYVGGRAPGRLEYRSWLHTTAHELTHWYIPTGFRFAEVPPSWFAEGFADYLALKILFVGDLIEVAEFIGELDQRWLRYRNNPRFGTQSIVEAEATFWEEDAYRFIYDGGSLAALLLDLGFRDRGGSLERVLRRLQRSDELTTADLATELARIPENRWFEAWLGEGRDPAWEKRFAEYGLIRRDGTLVATDNWVTDELSSIRP